MDTSQHDDRLSSLPNDVTHKILSFVSIKEAVKTSGLSSSWRFIWTSLPFLSFSSQDFDTLSKFHSFVNQVLFFRNNQIQVSSMNLCFHRDIIQELVTKVVDYAFSHNVQQLTISSVNCRSRIVFPLSPSSTLKHLTVRSIKAIYAWEFPALTTLSLSHIRLFDNTLCLLSKCANLKNLTLSHFTMERSSGASNIVDFCHSGLSNLWLENVRFTTDVMNFIALQLKNLSVVTEHTSNSAVLNVVAPQLKNLTIRDWPLIRLNLLSAELESYLDEDFYSLYVLCSMEKVDLSIDYTPFKTYTYSPFSMYKPNLTESHRVASLLQQLRNAKHLTLTWDIIQGLSSFIELISHQPSPFANLKSLKVYPHKALSDVEETMPTGVKKYLLDGSPRATLTMVSSKEMRALEKAASAQKLMAELKALLEQEKNNIENYRADTDLGKLPIESNVPNMQEQDHDNCSRMSEIDRCWDDLSVQIEKKKEKTYDIISKLHHIEGLLKKLPTSKKFKIQACYSSLRKEAHIVINQMIDFMNIKWNEKQSRLSFYYRELDTGPIEPPPPKGHMEPPPPTFARQPFPPPPYPPIRQISPLVMFPGLFYLPNN